MLTAEDLQRAIECGILNQEEVEQKLFMVKEKYILTHHPYAINQRKDGRFITSIREDDKPRRQITADSRQELIQKLYDHYTHNKDKVTPSDLYREWIARRKEGTEKQLDPKTIQRNVQHWKKYYEENPIVKTPIRKITVLQLNQYFNSTVTAFHLSTKELNNMKLILKEIFLMAVEEEIIEVNPMASIRITAKKRSIRKKASRQKVYLSQEYDTLQGYLKEQKTVQALAVRLCFQMGVRAGELVALKWEDVDQDFVHIQRMESKMVTWDRNGFHGNGSDVVDYVKSDATEGYRFIPQTDEARQILEELWSLTGDQEYLFMLHDKRMTEKAFSYWLERYCNDCGVPYKSPHCIRRTTASRLNSSQMPLDEIRRILGHCDERTTLGYLYNPKDEEETRQIMNRAL